MCFRYLNLIKTILQYIFKTLLKRRFDKFRCVENVLEYFEKVLI